MEEKKCYSPIEVAEMCEAYLRVYGKPSTNVEELNKYNEIVPEEVRKAASRLRGAIIRFNERGINPKQKESQKDLESHVQDYKDFGEFLLTYTMIV
jgi:hypothetical protein